MGNQTCKDCPTSVLFPEEDLDDEMIDWLGYTRDMEWSYPPSCFPGTELTPVQPDYFLFNNKNALNTTPKKSVLIVNRDHRKNRDCSWRKSRQKLKPVIEEFDETINNNNSNKNSNISNGMKMKWALKIMSNTMPQGTTLEKGEISGIPSGRVYIAMSHDPVTRRLKVAIIRAKNLTCIQDGGKTHCVISCPASLMTISLVHGDHVIDSYSTAVKTGLSDVLYYENFAFNLNELNLRGMSVVITAKHISKQRFFRQSHVIGTVVLNGLLVKEEGGVLLDRHLVDVTTRPRQTLYKWHTLWRRE